MRITPAAPSVTTPKIERTNVSPEALQALPASFALQMLHEGNQDPSPTTAGVPDLLTSLGLRSGQSAATNDSLLAAAVVQAESRSQGH